MSAEVPVAIIGIGCKFPGGSDNKDLFYDFLRSKGDGMIEPPRERWIHEEWYGGKDEPGKYHTTKLGFINGIDEFDALEFGISAKEASQFDPAIRLTLEAAQAALQDSGIDYRGSNTGVFFGNLLTTVDELDDDRYEVNNYNGIGRCVSIRANRISFTFDLRGPSLTVDTACSASATAMHLALCSIKLGEADQALVVGANTIINPEHTMMFSKLGVLSPTGSSKSFDASADGYARAEGVAAVLIKRLDRAIADGDSIYSVLTGSSVNANGKGKSLTMPEGDMQAETIKEAYRVANRHPSEAFFVELHATGTKVGDPIETNAAGKVFAIGRDAQKTLRVGSVKSNIGHAEGCSFLASLVKVSLMLHHKEIIPNIRFTKANPKIDFPALKMQVQTELEDITAEMAAADGRWVTSISSYGVGGSNAHIVMESAENVADLSKSVAAPATKAKPLYLFSVGSLTEPTLAHWTEALATAYRGVTDDRTLRSVARDLGRQTRAYPSRTFAIGSSLETSLKFSKPVLRNTSTSPKLCLVFAGQGPQHIFMGRQLAESYPAFLSSIQENDRILMEKYGQESMLERTGLFVPGVACKLAANGVWPVREVVLSLVFVQVALVDLVKSLGIQYDFVVGHSIGEIAMGYASGHYDRETAIGIAVARAAAMTLAEGNGAMAALGVGVQKAKTMIRKVLSQAKVTSGLWIAGINSPQAVTVAGTHELVDALIQVASDPETKVFNAKLRVTCAFHTPLMQPQEQLFKERVAATPLSQGTKKPFARVMSTTDGKWLDRDLDVDYCWDNIRRPVLFGTAIDQIIADEGQDGVQFLEIAPHPVLKAYIEQCGGEPISLIRRPNPKVPAQNTGEHYQLLEGIGNLLSAGFKNVDFDRLYASPDGTRDFVRAKLPEYTYNKSKSWAESGSQVSQRLRSRPNPISSPHFRLNVDSHPDLTGHIVFDAVLFPASGYVESILENGAMVVSDVRIYKPLVLNAAGSNPGHAGCVINGDKWEFRAATTPNYENGAIILDTAYAGGTFSRINPAYDEAAPRTFDFGAKLALSKGSLTGDEFYDAIPSVYEYRDHFRNYLKVIHEVEDVAGYHSKSYLTYLEIPEGTPDVYGKGYAIHPGILDSITQCGLALFINMETKQFDFNGVYLPVKIDAIRRWDSRDAPNMDSDLKKGIWTYFTPTVWGPNHPYRANYIIANTEGKVLFTIEGFEVNLAPATEPIAITDASREERLTTGWQPKAFPASLGPLSTEASLRSVFESLTRDAAAAGSKVLRVADVAKTSEIAVEVDSALSSLLEETGVVVEYSCIAGVAADADTKTGSLQYGHARSAVVESWTDTTLPGFDVVLHQVDLAAVQADIASITNLAGKNGIVLLTVTDSGTELQDAGVEPLSLAALSRKFSAISGSVVKVSDMVDGKALLAAQITQPTVSVHSGPSKTVIVQPFEHGTEGELIEIAKHLSSEAELWITGNDDAAGIGALGIASCIIAESPEYQVFSLLFEDHSLDEVAREKTVHDLRQNSLLLEQHMKIGKNGDVFVRRLAHGGKEVKESAIRAAGLTGATGGLAACFPPELKASDVEVAVKALGVGSSVTSNSALVFAGQVESRGVSAAQTEVGTEVVGITCQTPADVIIVREDAVTTLPRGISYSDAAAVLATFLSAWIGLVVRASVFASSTVLVHDGTSAAGFAALQIAKRFGAKVFATVRSRQEAATLLSTLDIPTSNVVLIDDFALTVAEWARSGAISLFDIIFNGSGKKVYARGSEYLSSAGSYIHIRSDEVPEIPSNAASVHILDINRLAATSPSSLIPAISALLSSHASDPFIVRSRPVALFEHKGAVADDVDSLVLLPDSSTTVRIDPSGQLFDPRKSYILVGGCSELGVRITEWMANRGARHIFMTSRRGPRGLTKTDNLYIHHLRQSGVQIEVIAADANDKEKTAAVLAQAQKAGPIGGFFVMTVVLRDAKFTNLTQESFDDVYKSKVAVLDTLLSCIDPATIDFILLFSTIGSVFGNAGQAAYCASQLYLDRIADVIPNTISMSFPPITDSGIFKRLVLASKGKANTAQLTKTGMTTAQVCNFIGDSLVRKIAHYVPMLAIGDVPQTFPTCEPLLYDHLLSKRFLSAGDGKDEGSGAESPASLLASLLSMDVEQISDNALITSFGLDSLGATRYSNLLKSRLGIQVSQVELLGSMTTGTLNEMLNKPGATSGAGNGLADDDGSAKYDHPLVPILNDRLAYDQPYTTDASPHQYRIWLAQREHDNTRKRTFSKLNASMSRYGATHWDTHESHFVTITSETPLDVSRMSAAIKEVVQRHGAFRTAFTWNEELGKLQQTIYPDIEFSTKLVDLSGESDPAAKAYETSLELNKEPNFKLDQLPLLVATMFDLGNKAWAFNVVVHHIIIDEASIAMFFYEMFQLYLEGPTSLPEVTYHYSDFSDWLLKTSERRAELREDDLEFWSERLVGAQPLHLALATPSTRELAPLTQIEGKIGAEVLEQYLKLSMTAAATPFSSFLAAYNLLLHKYSGQSTFAVGTAVTQRKLPMLSTVMGFFSNMLPIMTTINEAQTFVEYLAGFKTSVIECLAHDEATYEDLVGLGKSSSGSRGYFKHLFATAGTNTEIISQLNFNNITANHAITLPNGEEQYEFLLTVHPSNGKAVLRFDNHLFTETAARQFLDGYIALVETLGKNLDSKIQDISVVTESEHNRLIKELSTTAEPAVRETCLHRLVEEQAGRTPHLTAVEFDNERLTYDELNNLSNRVARSLVQQGVKTGDAVALCFDRGINQIVGVLAVLKAGGAFVPLDPDDPTFRQERNITESGANVLLTSSNHSRAFQKSLTSKVVIMSIDDPNYQKRLTRFDAHNLEVEGLSPSNLAYIMFTSGSTGEPKGVLLEHRSIANLLQSSELYGIKQGARVLSSLAYTFDPFIVDVFGTLSHGATLVTGRKELVLGDIPKALETLRINVLHVTPSILAVVPADKYPSLQTVVVAGETLGKKLIADWSGLVTLRNMYGPTEASVDCISCHVTSTDLTGVIGRPLPNCRVYILDKQLHPSPVGVEGELYIGGIQLARGYLNQPELTASAFIPSPFVPGERIYKSGDIALYRSDGNIEYCGRVDRQIKLRGQRIELGEIEDAIAQYPAAKRSAVIIRPVQDAPAVVAFVELLDSARERLEDHKEALKVFVAERLPRFMHPSLIAVLNQLPASRSGKVDWSALTQMDLTPFSPDSSVDIGTPSGDVEHELMNIFSKTLKAQHGTFGVSHDLFTIGMNSLIAVQAAGMISKAFNVHIGLNHIYLRPTIRELGNLILDVMGQDTVAIMEAEESEIDYIIEFLPVKRKGVMPRLFLVHNITGMATPFMRIGAYMPNEIHAFGDKHFGSATDFATIESMADHYTSLMKSVQPEGPYIISGYSFGGQVAICMADKLTRAGEKVEHLILLDAVYMPVAERERFKSTDWTQRSVDWISANFPDNGEKWVSKLRVEVQKNVNSQFDFEPPHYDGRTTLVVPRDRAWYRSGLASGFDTGMDDHNGWDCKIPNLDIKVAAGTHDTMFAPANVKVLAEVMNELLNA